MTTAFLAPQKEFESPTFRLGGGRSILLSYWGVCDYHCNQKRIACQHFPVENVPVIAYTVRSVLERRLYYDRIEQRIPGLG